MFNAFAGLVGPLGWHIVLTVQAASESKSSTLFAVMEAALQGQSFQPAKRICGHEIALKRPGRCRDSYLGTLCKPPHTSSRLVRPAHKDTDVVPPAVSGTVV